MKLLSIRKLAFFIAVCFIVNGMIGIGGAGAEEFSFKVYNSTRYLIKKILVSEDGNNWGYFDIGSGIKAGETVTLIWGANTKDEKCDQFVKAVYEDGEESEPAKFNFCEKGLELEF